MGWEMRDGCHIKGVKEKMLEGSSHTQPHGGSSEVNIGSHIDKASEEGFFMKWLEIFGTSGNHGRPSAFAPGAGGQMRKKGI